MKITFQASGPMAALEDLGSRMTAFNLLMGILGKQLPLTCKGMVEIPRPCSKVRVKVEAQLSHSQ